MNLRQTGARTKRVEIKNTKLKIVIEAEYAIDDLGDTDYTESIERALDTLREYGTANIVKRTITGEPIR